MALKGSVSIAEREGVVELDTVATYLGGKSESQFLAALRTRLG